ncbi:hypothetical protein [Brevibacillus centrosporus]|uniref:hypothetical protein n=1 Tax=Brevibacillus centrosporus TaxID=54910 RepID=UPI003801FF08
MNDIRMKYEQLVSKEDDLTRMIATYDACVDTLINLVFEKGDNLHHPTIERILTTIQTVGDNLISELVQIRYRKAALANQFPFHF